MDAGCPAPARDAASGATQILHASCVAIDGGGVVITGASGSGKSTLALQLMGFGARLVADDRTCVTAGADGLIATAPDSIRGLIEARGIGILNADPADRARVRLLVDLDQAETRRLPDPSQTELMGQRLPLLRKVDAPHFAAAIMQFAKAGRWEA